MGNRFYYEKSINLNIKRLVVPAEWFKGEIQDEIERVGRGRCQLKQHIVIRTGFQLVAQAVEAARLVVEAVEKV